VKAHDLRKPALDLSDVVRQPCTLITGASSELPITRIAVVVGQSGPPLYIDSGPETVHSPTTLMGGWNIVGLATGIFVRRWWSEWDTISFAGYWCPTRSHSGGELF
jgi:hypothetical protein